MITRERVRIGIVVAAALLSAFGAILWYETMGAGAETVVFGQPVSLAGLGTALNRTGLGVLMFLAVTRKN
jgi:hypothetical protein